MFDLNFIPFDSNKSFLLSAAITLTVTRTLHPFSSHYACSPLNFSFLSPFPLFSSYHSCSQAPKRSSNILPPFFIIPLLFQVSSPTWSINAFMVHYTRFRPLWHIPAFLHAFWRALNLLWLSKFQEPVLDDGQMPTEVSSTTTRCRIHGGEGRKWEGTGLALDGWWCECRHHLENRSKLWEY